MPAQLRCTGMLNTQCHCAMAQGTDNKTGGGCMSSALLEPSPKVAMWLVVWGGFLDEQLETLPWLQLPYNPLHCKAWLQTSVWPLNNIPRLTDEFIAVHSQMAESAAFPQVSLPQPTFSPRESPSCLRPALPFHTQFFYRRVISLSFSKHLKNM